MVHELPNIRIGWIEWNLSENEGWLDQRILKTKVRVIMHCGIERKNVENKRNSLGLWSKV